MVKGRVEASFALMELRDFESMGALIAALQDSDNNYGVKCNVAAALTAMEAQEAIEPLIEMLQGGTSYMECMAASALERMTGQALGVDNASWNDWWSENK